MKINCTPDQSIVGWVKRSATQQKDAFVSFVVNIYRVFHYNLTVI